MAVLWSGGPRGGQPWSPRRPPLKDVLTPKAKTPNRPADLDWVVTGLALFVGGGCLLLWLGGQAASLLTGNGFAAGPVTAGARALLADRDDPAAAWDSAMPGAPIYWWITAIAIGI